MLLQMRKRPDDEELMNLFTLQFEWHLPKNPEFHVEYLLWYNRVVDDPVRNYTGIWELVHDFVRRKKDFANRKQSMKDHLPGMAGFLKGGGGKGTGKDKNGDPQVCFAWRNTGVCAKKDAGTCNYAHPISAKNTWKPSSTKGKGKSKDGKRSSSTQSLGGKGGKDMTWSPSTPRGETVTDPKLLYQHFLNGQCSKGKSCTYHHNGVCTFHKKGICNKGADCVFSHHDPPAAALPVRPEPKSAAAKAEAKAKATKKE